MIRIALLADIHGNSIALEAVLADIDAQGRVDEYWVLGDLVAIGHDPVGVLERLCQLPNARFVRGNTDRYLVTGEHPNPTLEEVEADLSLVPKFAEVARSFAWTLGAVVYTGWLDWLSGLPLEQRLTLPDRSRLLGVHASPGQDDGDGVHPGTSDAELRALIIGCDADLVCVGHRHWPMDLIVGDVRLVNVGSVSNPLPPDLRSDYVILEADESGYGLQHWSVEYDHEAVITAVQRVRHPAAGYITSFMRGQHRPPWA